MMIGSEVSMTGLRRSLKTRVKMLGVWTRDHAKQDSVYERLFKDSEVRDEIDQSEFFLSLRNLDVDVDLFAPPCVSL